MEFPVGFTVNSYHSPVYDEVVMEILQTSEQLKNYTFYLNKTNINDSHQYQVIIKERLHKTS